MKHFDQRQYWRDRLAGRVDISTVGHKSLGEDYNRFLYARRLEVLQRVLALHGIDPRGRTVLDIGCGSGIYTSFWKDRGADDYTGVDLSPRGVEALRVRHPAYSFVCADITDSELDLGTRSFDVVTLFDVLYHITDNARAAKALANIAATLRAHGKLLVFDQLSRRDDYQLRPHVKFRSLGQFTRMLSAAELRIVARYPLFSLLSPSIRGRRIIDMPVCAAYATVGATMRRVRPLARLLGRLALAFDRLLLDRLNTRPSNGELFVIERKGG